MVATARGSLAVMMLIGVCGTAGALDLYSENPFYWSRDGKPVLLLGGSGDDNLFQWAGRAFGNRLEEHLDLLVAVGGNYVRNTMSSRNHACDGYNDDEMAYPFRRLPSGKYDLDAWDDDYWERLDRFLRATHARGIFVQLEIWDLYAVVGRAAWAKQPWNPDNNVNYTYEETPLRRGVSGFPLRFLSSAPSGAGSDALGSYQRRFIGRMLDTTLRYDHVLYQIDNESPLDFAVSDYWARLVLDAAATVGRQVHICDSRRFHAPSPYVTKEFRDWKNPDVHRPILNSELYKYCDISQNGGNTGQIHYENLVWYRERLVEHGPRPINHVKIYKFIWPTGEDWHARRTPEETTHATRRFWRSVFGGAASVRHHRDKCGFGLGLSERAQADIKSMRMLTDAMDLFRMAPDNSVLGARDEDEAYALLEPGKQLAVYFTGAGDASVSADLGGMFGNLRVRWLDIERSGWLAEESVEGGETRVLIAPMQGECVVLVQRP